MQGAGWRRDSADSASPLPRRAGSLGRPDSNVEENPSHDGGRLGWRTMRPGTGCRTPREGLGKPKLTNGGKRKWHPRGGGAGGADPEFIRTERSSHLFVGRARSWWILPAPGPWLRGSACPQGGQGTVSCRTCLPFSSLHSYLGSLSLPYMRLGEALQMPCSSVRKRQVELQGTRSPTFCLFNRSHPRTTPSLHSRPWAPPIKNP